MRAYVSIVSINGELFYVQFEISFISISGILIVKLGKKLPKKFKNNCYFYVQIFFYAHVFQWLEPITFYGYNSSKYRGEGMKIRMSLWKFLKNFSWNFFFIIILSLMICAANISKIHTLIKIDNFIKYSPIMSS